MAEKFGQDLVDFGVSADTQEAKRSLFTNRNEGCNPPKRKKSSKEGLFHKRMTTTTYESTVLKIRSVRDINTTKREFSVSNSASSRTNYQIQICSSPSCSCPDFQRNGLRVFCKQTYFICFNICSRKRRGR